ncbi:MAG: PhoH family protein, partial [Rhodoferax sp.]|nr:PhoH family protein [Rhodoferax sp.]
MPLPAAPTKRAALLSEQDYDVPARTQPKARKTESPAIARPLVAERPLTRTTPRRIDVATQAVALVDLGGPENRGPADAPYAVVRQGDTETEPAARPRPKKTKHTGRPKLFVLDTNVLL